ncbi:hypothetical protein A1O1_07317 [Capronia coronata CBS 617.96]|uniref:Uncharacterized protein n=1 Tax=Capronia coronata CBS 617.96 TaxID=1182541 RepID=W9XTY1_9EURO|nr:uncharacterized protein A1O1_07317 [Capronia coronata CBS 617.96]EXJ83693.1 hypothetical protein A1O1_07317 [Capronia coronata CBS 617.96]
MHQNSHSNLNPPRHLLFRHAARLLNARLDVQEDQVQTGYEYLRSYYIPGLQGRPYTIHVDQPIQAGAESTTLSSDQTFEVVATKYTLPKNAIHSVYPPQGHEDGIEVLPHVIFNDPTLPWERVGSSNADDIKPDEPHYDDYFGRNRVPWLALLVFTQGELQMAKADLDKDTGIFSGIDEFKTVSVEQSAMYTVNMAMGDVGLIKDCVSPITKPDPNIEKDARGDVLLLPRALFGSLFTKFDKDGKPETTAPDVYPYRFLAHRRDINSQGMTVSGTATIDDSGSFGVVHSHMSGPFSITQPPAVFVHLLSIEGVEQMSPWPISSEIRFVAMCSLASWSYICLPPGTPNVQDQFLILGKSLDLLRPKLEIEDANKLLATKPHGPMLLQQLNNGYSVSRYRTQTGETTACFMRGPFIPDDVNHPLKPWWTSLSTCGTDLQILDQELGLMDISYSSAWQLGRTLAIADQAFTAALSRLRKAILDQAMNDAQKQALQTVTSFKSKDDLLQSISHSVATIGRLHKTGLLQSPHSMFNRWRRPPVKPLDLSYHGKDIAPFKPAALDQAALEIASTPDAKDPTQPSDTPYDEYDTPILSHYLITDASHVPPESLRFFKVDPNWTDALIDGALSLANHIDRDDDKVRCAMKKAINRFLSTPTSNLPPDLSYPPPVPTYGCYIRSELVTKFPYLIVETEPKVAGDHSPILLRHEVVDKGTMLCLFPRAPSSTEFAKLIFTQPPHQQTFIAAAKIEPSSITMDYRRAYTVSDPKDDNMKEPILPNVSWTKAGPNDRPLSYIWDQVDKPTQKTYEVRRLLLDNLAPDVRTTLHTMMPNNWFSDDVATSALMANQLNNPAWSLEIDLSTKAVLSHFSASTENEQKPRVLPLCPAKTPPPVSSRIRQSEPKLSFTVPAHLDSRARAIRHTPLPVTHPPPHHRMTDILPPDFKFAVPNVGDVPEDPAKKPVLNYFFWSADVPGTPANPGQVPMRADMVPQDIIFSIRILRNTFNYHLLSIQITIPLGKPLQNFADNPGPLTKHYTGPGETMLSNLRFNPLLNISDDRNTLVIRLLPRSTKGFVLLSQQKELSFMSSGVAVDCSPDTVPYVNVRPDIVEVYQGYTQPPQQDPLPLMVLGHPAAKSWTSGIMLETSAGNKYEVPKGSGSEEGYESVMLDGFVGIRGLWCCAEETVDRLGVVWSK